MKAWGHGVQGCLLCAQGCGESAHPQFWHCDISWLAYLSLPWSDTLSENGTFCSCSLLLGSPRHSAGLAWRTASVGTCWTSEWLNTSLRKMRFGLHLQEASCELVQNLRISIPENWPQASCQNSFPWLKSKTLHMKALSLVPGTYAFTLLFLQNNWRTYILSWFFPFVKCHAENYEKHSLEKQEWVKLQKAVDVHNTGWGGREEKVSSTQQGAASGLQPEKAELRGGLHLSIHFPLVTLSIDVFSTFLM